MPIKAPCQWLVKQRKTVHLPREGEVAVYFPKAGEVHGYTATESLVEVFLWVWDVWLERGDKRDQQNRQTDMDKDSFCRSTPQSLMPIREQCQ